MIHLVSKCMEAVVRYPTTAPYIYFIITPLLFNCHFSITVWDAVMVMDSS